jgi:type I restriction enzyme S subunit
MNDMKQNWEVKKLGKLFDIKSSKRVHKSDWKSEGVPFYRAREVVKLANYGFVENDLFISNDLYKKYTQEKGFPKEGDILVSAVGTLGKCYLVKKSDQFYFKDASVLWLENNGNVNSKYIEYLFKSNLVKSQIIEGSMGATVGTLTINRANNIKIPIPPLEEQKQIVAILDKAFKKIDEGIKIAKQNLKNAKELFESYLQEIFENKGDDWEEKTLGEICNIISGQSPEGKFYNSDSKGLPFYQGKKEFSNKFISSPRVWTTKVTKEAKKDDVLISVRAPVGEINICTQKICIGRGLAAIRVKNKINRDFLYNFLIKQKKFIIGNEGAVFNSINKTQITNITIPTPPLEEQQKIVNKLNQLQEKNKALETIYQQKLANLEELKKSILQKAFNGELIKLL